ncbi:DinB superfamily protein [Planctomycetes bacterium MalM25]|nr:DinB superfamily protein [Planctomycetes bacterium MalM25]
MNAIQAIQASAATSDMVLKSYLSDLEDADLFKRPHPECNHLAWQLGHLIASECNLVEVIKPGSAIELPEGFADKHSKETAGDNDPANFATKEEYLALFDKVRSATSETVATLSEADLDAPNPKEEWRDFMPTVGSVCVLTASHPMMHAGQFVPVRREAGKPVLM